MEETQTYARHEYAQRDFWNSRFTEYKSAFDWYVGWSEMRKMITSNFPADTTDNVLMVGCGNSSNFYIELSEAMSKNGYYVTNIDISNIVIEQMIAKTSQDYILMDATNTCFRDRAFDLVLDKGTFDALAV
jgi:ubiquinone/menaquinone biosynthesis C-methylase UbiE